MLKSLLRMLPRAGAGLALCAALAGTALAQDYTPAPRALLLDAAFAGKRVVAVGERGRILLSDNDGRTWRRVAAPTQATLTAVYFPDPRHGWAVGHDAVILHSADAGVNWQRQFEAPQEEKPLLDVWFRDARQGFAIGAYGLFLETRDGGKTWSQRKIAGGDYHFNAVAATGSGHLVIAGERGRLLRSDDGGATWAPLPSPYAGSLFGVLALKDNSLLTFGLRGKLFRSDNAGAGWRPLPTATDATLLGGSLSADGSVAIVGLGGTVLTSLDGGRDFTLDVRPGRRAFAAALPAGERGLQTFGEAGVSRFALPAPTPGRKP